MTFFLEDEVKQESERQVEENLTDRVSLDNVLDVENIDIVEVWAEDIENFLLSLWPFEMRIYNLHISLLFLLSVCMFYIVFVSYTRPIVANNDLNNLLKIGSSVITPPTQELGDNLFYPKEETNAGSLNKV